jgi:hypothetical protein
MNGIAASHHQAWIRAEVQILSWEKEKGTGNKVPSAWFLWNTW